MMRSCIGKKGTQARWAMADSLDVAMMWGFTIDAPLWRRYVAPLWLVSALANKGVGDATDALGRRPGGVDWVGRDVSNRLGVISSLQGGASGIGHMRRLTHGQVLPEAH
jgi:hypothetical protein